MTRETGMMQVDEAHHVLDEVLCDGGGDHDEHHGAEGQHGLDRPPCPAGLDVRVAAGEELGAVLDREQEEDAAQAEAERVPVSTGKGGSGGRGGRGGGGLRGRVPVVVVVWPGAA